MKRSSIYAGFALFSLFSMIFSPTRSLAVLFFLAGAGLGALALRAKTVEENAALKKFSSDTPALSPTIPAPSSSSSLPGVEQRGREVRTEDNVAGTGSRAATDPECGGEGGSVGEVGSAPHLLLMPPTPYKVVYARNVERRWRWRCRCGVKMHGFFSSEDAYDAHHRHVDIEDSIETMTRGRAS